MLFNSIEFAIFLPIAFLLYWFAVNKNLKVQNAFLLIISYIFYGWWDYRFLSLIAFSSVLDYFIGVQLGKEQKENKRKILLWTSICVNIGFLGFFKYYNFFVESFAQAFTLFGQEMEPARLAIVLPVGISFYTFQTLSYSIDVYKRKMEPTSDFIAFLSYVSFFPQLVAGPIERAVNLLPQFYKKRVFDYEQARDGMKQILWGLAKKVVIADNVSPAVNEIFTNYQEASGSVLFMGAFYFAIQIYCDFSAYSDIAIGTARLFGFNLMRNFNFPYFSRDIGEFWRRWHISLSTWFRDYIYIPLGGSRVSKLKVLRNTMIIFVVSGFWHGANWTFIAWGAVNALYFIPLYVFNLNRRNLDTIANDSFLPSIREFLAMSLTFFLTCIAWIFFRAESIGVAFDYIGRLFTPSLFTTPDGYIFKLIYPLGLFVIEYLQRHKQHGLQMEKVPIYLRYPIYYVLIYMILNMGGQQQSFIYFQF